VLNVLFKLLSDFCNSLLNLLNQEFTLAKTSFQVVSISLTSWSSHHKFITLSKVFKLYFASLVLYSLILLAVEKTFSVF
jgi:hypothetical protein